MIPSCFRPMPTTQAIPKPNPSDTASSSTTKNVARAIFCDPADTSSSKPLDPKKVTPLPPPGENDEVQFEFGDTSSETSSRPASPTPSISPSTSASGSNYIDELHIEPARPDPSFYIYVDKATNTRYKVTFQRTFTDGRVVQIKQDANEWEKLNPFLAALCKEPTTQLAEQQKLTITYDSDKDEATYKIGTKAPASLPPSVLAIYKTITKSMDISKTEFEIIQHGKPIEKPRIKLEKFEPKENRASEIAKDWEAKTELNPEDVMYGLHIIAKKYPGVFDLYGGSNGLPIPMNLSE